MYKANEFFIKPKIKKVEAIHCTKSNLQQLRDFAEKECLELRIINGMAKDNKDGLNHFMLECFGQHDNTHEDEKFITIQENEWLIIEDYKISDEPNFEIWDDETFSNTHIKKIKKQTLK